MTVDRNAQTLSGLFEMMEDLKKTMQFDYSVSDSSLSSTFVRFVEEQRLEAESEDAGIAEREEQREKRREPVAEWLGHLPWTNEPKTRCRALNCKNFATSMCCVCKKFLCVHCYNKEESHLHILPKASDLMVLPKGKEEELV